MSILSRPFESIADEKKYKAMNSLVRFSPESEKHTAYGISFCKIHGLPHLQMKQIQLSK